MKDYYTILDLNSSATDDEIRTQYRQLVRIYHPDRFSNPADKIYAERKMQEINEAYFGLLAPERTGKGVNRRLTQSSEKYPLLTANPSSVMILLSVLFVGVILGGVDYDALVNVDPEQTDKSFMDRLFDSWGGIDGSPSNEPLHEWLSFSVFENYQNVLYVVDEEGEPQMEIVQAGHSPSWSPDRSQLAFLSPERDGTQIYTMSATIAAAGSTREKGGIDPGGNLSRITQDSDTKKSLAWSPDGLKLSYIGYANDVTSSVLKMANLETNEIVLLTSPRMGSVDHAVWLDNDSLLVNLIQDGNNQIYLIPLDGRAATPFVTFPSRDPSVDPTGQRIALGGDDGIFTLLRSGSNVSQLTAEPAWQPVWSPTGDKIAYLSSLPPVEDGPNSAITTLWVVDTDGQNQLQLTKEGTLAFAWSIDGDALAFITGNLQTQPPTLYLWTITLGGKSKLIAEISEPHITWGRGL